jgi:hypothetical protein
MRVDDPGLQEKFAALRAAGLTWSDQYDARLLWLEREIDRLADYVEALEGRLLTKIDGKPRPNWPDPDPDEEWRS